MAVNVWVSCWWRLKIPPTRHMFQLDISYQDKVVARIQNCLPLHSSCKRNFACLLIDSYIRIYSYLFSAPLFSRLININSLRLNLSNWVKSFGWKQSFNEIQIFKIKSSLIPFFPSLVFFLKKKKDLICFFFFFSCASAGQPLCYGDSSGPN